MLPYPMTMVAVQDNQRKGRGTLGLLVGLILLALPAVVPAAVPLDAQTAVPFVSVDLSSYLNNAGVGSVPGRADFDGAGDAFPPSIMPASGTVTAAGVTFQRARGPEDNVVAEGQSIALPPGPYMSAYLLVASSAGTTMGTVTVHYADGSTSRAPLGAPDWSQVHETPVLVVASRFGPGATEAREAGIFLEQVWLHRSRRAISLTLPTTAVPAPHAASMHIFALSLLPSVRSDAVALVGAQATTKLTSTGLQVVEAVLANTGNVDHTSRNPITVALHADGAITGRPAHVVRLPAGEEVRIRVAIKRPTSASVAGELAGTLVARAGGLVLGTAPVVVPPIVPYAATAASLATHESPDWYNNAKFGIFIHYGLYSVPAWAPTGGVYAEWYWHSMEQKGSPTYTHQLQTYGPNFRYDDFIPRLTAAKFDPRAWVELFKEAGARYFVIVSKHHDGFALFRTAVSHRNSVDMVPHRDIVGDLFAADRRYTPGIHPGVYYSLPEWFNPSYSGIDGKKGNFPGGSPRDYITGAPIAYTGYIPVSSYVADYQTPQMLELIDQYHPDLLWCDIGGENDSLDVIAHFYNTAPAGGSQVAVNNRCGIDPHDFTTAEYRDYPMIVHAKWEMSRGLDPHSFGYNRNTPRSAYASAASLIHLLVDVVSKNGNLLLDIGPRGDGSIPGIMQRRLRQVGTWLAVNGQAIYHTAYWWRMSADGNLRFTERPNAFYITSLARPGPRVTVHAPVPLLLGDSIHLLGWNGGALRWNRSNGHLTIDVPEAARHSGQYAWVFKIG